MKYFLTKEVILSAIKECLRENKMKVGSSDYDHDQNYR